MSNKKKLYKVGILGEGEYKASINGKNTRCYKYWSSMLQRCYDEKVLIKRPTYKDCTVCEEWHNFQTFAKWFKDNYYTIDEEKMCLDKDILYKGNKVYSPDTCVFVPQRINGLFVKSNSIRGKYPVGVYLCNNKFRSRCSILKNGKKIIKHIGYSNTPEKAFEKYKNFKEQYIKEVADYYKDKIPQNIYEAMYKYVVEIDD